MPYLVDIFQRIKTDEELIDWLRSLPQVIDVMVVGEDQSEICIETPSPNDAEIVRSLMTRVQRETTVSGSRVYII